MSSYLATSRYSEERRDQEQDLMLCDLGKLVHFTKPQFPFVQKEVEILSSIYLYVKI